MSTLGGVLNRNDQSLSYEGVALQVQDRAKFDLVSKLVKDEFEPLPLYESPIYFRD